MGDRYELILDCTYCGKQNEDIWYAPTSGSMTFKCEKCGKINFIKSDLKAYKVENIKYEDVEDAISSTSNMMDDKIIKRVSREFYNKFKIKEIKK